MPMLKLHESTDPKDIERVIRNGPVTCVHPVTLEALWPGDWAVAWMEDRRGTILGRVIGTAKEKIYRGQYYQNASHPMFSKEHFSKELLAAGWSQDRRDTTARVRGIKWPKGTKPHSAAYQIYVTIDPTQYMVPRLDLICMLRFQKIDQDVFSLCETDEKPYWSQVQSCLREVRS